ncbi:MAG: glycosyltransferase family 2 protein [Anaerolineae bacterium]|nr:glycosyltransferase family 2 protein [Anaerolineae bacterium]MDK1081007.1 glycosyltransferase family 2 protein [Anaerolineae bacterium]MDK1117474.1 glycosyltransferase family 2 protein [Anaerolineae bacterium]
MKISVVVPVYNSSDTLPLLVDELRQVLPKITPDFELILINDCSTDSSWEVISKLIKTYAWVRGIDLMRNYGQHNATLCGIREARYEVVVVMDDDLQNPPREIPKLIEKLNEGFDVVYGVARKRQHTWWKNLASVIFKRAIAFVMGVKTVRDIGAFKAFRTDIRNSFKDFKSPDVLVDVLLSWGASRFTSVLVDESPRAVGKSNYNLLKLIKVSLLVLTSYTTIPLRIASILGFLFTLFGVGVLIYVLTIFFTLGSIDGFPFLASTITIFSGVQLFALGIMGEYLARVFERTGGRPTYTIARIVEK